MRGSLGLVLAAGAVVLLAACTASGEPSPSPSPPPPSEPAPDPSVSEPAPDPWVSLIATADGGSVEVFDAPDAAGPTLTVTAADAVSYPDATPLTFLVVDEAEARTTSPDADAAPPRLQVLLPGAAQGEEPGAPGTPLDLPTGWVRAGDVTVATTDLRIEVRLGDGRLLLHRADDVVLDVPVALGPAAPRPGRTFLTELVTPPSADAPYGAYAYGLAGYPTALVGFGSADGLVGIHGGADDAGAPPDDPGTDEPGSVRLTDADVTRLVTELGLPLGTPVDVVA